MCKRFLLLATAVLLSPHVRGEEPSEKKDEWRDLTPDWSYASAALKPPVRTDAKRAAEIVEKINATAAEKLTTDDVIALYRAVPYEMVRQIADTGFQYEGKTYQIAQEKSIALANLRDGMINETYKRLAEKLQADLTRLDFGNKLSGMKSDVDHTAYWPWDDARFKETNIRAEFERMWELMWKLPLAECDICVHDGRNAVPDWRGTETVAEFHDKAVRVFKGLAGTPEAYAQEGPWRMQVEGRSLEGSEAVLKKLHDLEVEAQKADLTPEQRQEIAERKRAAEEGNPCTRFAYDAEAKRVEMSKDASILSELFRGVKGDVLRMYAFDCSVGNYLFHMHHPDKAECPKYVLRSFEEGVSILRKVPEGTALKPARYDKLDDAGRTRLIAELYPEKMRDQVRRVLDAALVLRQNHKLPADKQKPPREVWRGMMDYLQKRSGGQVTDEDTLLRMAKLEYNRASTEVMVWNNQVTAHARTQGWLSPDSLPERESVELSKWLGFQRTKLQFSAFYALKQAFAYLPEDQVERIIEEAPEHQRESLRILRDVVRTEIARNGRITLAPEIRENWRDWARRTYDAALKSIAQRYEDFWAAAREGYYTDEAITARVLDSLCETAGYEYRLVYDGMVREGPAWVKEWDPAVGLNNLLSSGNVLSALQVFQVHQRGGSPDEVVAALLVEALSNVPGIAHFIAFRDACNGNWGGAKFLLTGSVLQFAQDYARREGIGWVTPLGANMLVYFGIAKAAVEIVGYEIFEPLTQDEADFMYTGRVGTSEKAPPWGADPARRLETLRRMLADARRKMAAPAMGYKSPEWQTLVKQVRDLVPEIAELERQKGAYEEWQARTARSRAGLIRPGVKGVIEASFTPALGPQIPLVLCVADPTDEEGGVIELGAKPLTAAERDRLDNLERQRLGLQKGEGPLLPPERIDRLCDLSNQIEALRERDRLAARAARYHERFRTDPEARTEALRQNLHPFFEKALIAAAEDKRAVVQKYVREWYDREHMQTRGLGLHEEALRRVVERMIRDLEASERLFTSFELWDSRREMARIERQEKRREFLRNRLMEEATTSWLERSRPECTAHGLLLRMRSAPPAPPVIRTEVAVVGEGEEARMDVRVKVTASPIHWPPPYRVMLIGAGGGASEDPKAKKRLLKVRVLAADDREVGTAEVPLTIHEREPSGPSVLWIGPFQDYGKGGVEAVSKVPEMVRAIRFDPYLMSIRMGEATYFQEEFRKAGKKELAAPEGLPLLVQKFPSLKEPYRAPHWLRVVCNGEVRYLYRTGIAESTPGRSWGIGNLQYLGLRSGTSYAMEVTALTETGERVQVRGTILARAEKEPVLARLEESRQALEKVLAQPAGLDRDRSLERAFVTYFSRVLLIHGGLPCDEYLKLVEQQYEAHMRLVEQTWKKQQAEGERLRRLGSVIGACAAVGNSAALSLAQKMFPLAEALARPGVEADLSLMSTMSYEMARLATTARGDASLARQFLERNYALESELEKIQGDQSWRKRYGPKSHEEAAQDWPKAFGLP